MGKLKNKFVSLFMVFVVVFTMMTPVFAYSDSIDEDFENILSSDFQSRNYDKTFVIPGYENLKNMGIIFDNNYNSKGYSCFIQYINSDFKSYHLLENSFEDKVYDLEKGYYYILYLGNSSVNQFSIYDVYCEELEDNTYVYSLYNFAANYNKSRRDFIVSKDGIDWFYIDNDLNIDNVDLNTVPLSDYITDESGFINRPMNILYFSPDLASHFSENTKLKDTEVASKYTNLTSSLYQFGTGHIPSELLLYPTNITISENNFKYPSSTTEYTLKVPYDISYLEETENEIIDNNAPHVYWTSLGNHSTLEVYVDENGKLQWYQSGNIIYSRYLNSITLSLYTGNVSGKYELCIYPQEEYMQEVDPICRIPLYSGNYLKENTTYHMEINLQNKCSLETDKIYMLGIGYKTDAAYFATPLVYVQVANGFKQDTIYYVDSNDKYSIGYYGPPSNPEDLITGDMYSEESPKLSDDIQIDETVELKNSDNIFEQLYNSFVGFFEKLSDLIDSLLEKIYGFINQITNISQLVGKVFETFPQEFQDILSIIFTSFGFYILIRLLLKILGR